MSKGQKIEGKPAKKRRFLPLLKRILVWTFWIVLLWWGASAIIPGLPTPLHGGKAILYLAKDIGDMVYFTAREGDLEESAREVREQSSQVGKRPNTYLQDSISAERLKRMPILSEADDSVVRSMLQSVSEAPPIGGRVFNVLVMGIDSRLGVRDARADAIHVVTVNPDSGVVEFLSIPRDTYCDLGFPDTTTFNIVANARGLGYHGFMKEVQAIAHRGPINYYVEVGFSQAMGVLEVLGYKNPVSTLRFLRTRKTLPGGDLQRAHNQARFMADNLEEKFHLLTGSTGDLFLMAGLQFVTTNLTKDICEGIIYNLQKAGFPNQRDDAVRLRILSPMRIRLREMPADSATVATTLRKVQQGMRNDSTEEINVAARLRNINRLAMKDSAHAYKVVRRLSRIFQQKGWLQVQDETAREGIRDTLTTLLRNAYIRQGKTEKVEEIDEARKAEEFLLNHYR